MPHAPTPLPRSLLAATGHGAISETLPPGGNAVEVPDPAAPAIPVAVVGDAGTAGVLTDNGFAISGDRGTANIGRYGVAIVGQSGTARGGAAGICIANSGGTAHTGDGGIAFTRANGVSWVEGWGVAIALEGGVVSGWDNCAIVIGYPVDGGKFKLKVGVIGENGLLPNTRYTLDAYHNFVAV